MCSRAWHVDECIGTGTVPCCGVILLLYRQQPSRPEDVLCTEIISTSHLLMAGRLPGSIPVPDIIPAGFSLFHLGKSRPIPFVTNISLVITGMVNCLTIKLLITNFIEIIFLLTERIYWWLNCSVGTLFLLMEMVLIVCYDSCIIANSEICLFVYSCSMPSRQSVRRMQKTSKPWGQLRTRMRPPPPWSTNSLR